MIESNGVDDRIEYGVGTWGTRVNSSPAVTIALFAELDGNLAGAIPMLLGNDIHGGVNGFNMRVDSSAGGYKIRIGGRSDLSDPFRSFQSTDTYSYGDRHHFAGVIDYFNGEICFFADGIQDVSSPTSVSFGNSFYTMGTPTNNDQICGYVTVLPTVQAVGGIVNETAIWKKRLTVPQINALATSGVKYTPSGIEYFDLESYCPMDNGPDGSSADGDIVRDLSKNGDNGTGNNGANNTGLTWRAENFLSYPSAAILVRNSFLGIPSDFFLHKLRLGVQEGLRIGMR